MFGLGGHSTFISYKGLMAKFEHSEHSVTQDRFCKCSRTKGGMVAAFSGLQAGTIDECNLINYRMHTLPPS